MGCVEAAHKLLSLALSRTPQSSPILARLALLQLKKGFIYDGNQVRSTWLAERMRGEEQPKAEAPLSVCSLLSVVANDLCLKLWKRLQHVDSPTKDYKPELPGSAIRGNYCILKNLIETLQVLKRELLLSPLHYSLWKIKVLYNLLPLGRLLMNGRTLWESVCCLWKLDSYLQLLLQVLDGAYVSLKNSLQSVFGPHACQHPDTVIY